MIKYSFFKLNQICSKITDGSHYSPTGIDNGIPMLSVKDMENNGFSYESCKYISNDDYLDLVKADCKPLVNDILIAKDGSYLKHVFVVKENVSQAILSSIGILRPNLEKVYPEYIKYYLQTKSVIETVSKKYVSGSALPRIILKNFGEIEIIKKNLSTQKQIAKVLSDLDAKIEVNNKINQELEAMAKTLYDYWFLQFDFPNVNDKPYKSSGGKMVFNENLKREIPEGWEDGVLSDIANITMGQSPSGSSYNDEGVGTVFYQGSTDFGQRFPTVRKFTTEPSRMAEEGDILLSVRAPVGTLNQAMEDCCIGRGLAALREKEGSISFLWSQMEYFKKIFDRRNASGTTFGSITKDDLFGLKVCIPQKEILNRFKKIADPFHDKIIINSKQNQKLSELRDWLIPMLMNGQVTVGKAEEELGMAAEESAKYGK